MKTKPVKTLHEIPWRGRMESEVAEAAVETAENLGWTRKPGSDEWDVRGAFQWLVKVSETVVGDGVVGEFNDTLRVRDRARAKTAALLKKQPLAEDEERALARWARDHGRNWKADLRAAWMRSQYPHPTTVEDAAILQGLRNTRGPSFLAGFKGFPV